MGSVCFIRVLSVAAETGVHTVTYVRSHFFLSHFLVMLHDVLFLTVGNMDLCKCNPAVETVSERKHP
jgi:hypothetical protein